MHSNEARQKQTFLRNEYLCAGKWNIPIVRSQPLAGDVRLIACSDTRPKEEYNRECGVHFFVDDYRFEHIYDRPQTVYANIRNTNFFSLPTILCMRICLFGGR